MLRQYQAVKTYVVAGLTGISTGIEACLLAYAEEKSGCQCRLIAETSLPFEESTNRIDQFYRRG